MTWLFLQCADGACRFRFPAPAAEATTVAVAATVQCPRCHGPVVVVARSSQERPPQSDSPDVGRELVGLLDNIRSIHNVGSMFRSADGAGVTHLYLAGITATPNHPRLAKAALGAHESVSWSYATNAVELAATLRSEGYHLWALERVPSSSPIALSMSDRPERLALVVGNERAGVDPDIMALCDGILSLPMVGRKSSLNAAVAFGIATYALQFETVGRVTRREASKQG